MVPTKSIIPSHTKEEEIEAPCFSNYKIKFMSSTLFNIRYQQIDSSKRSKSRHQKLILRRNIEKNHLWKQVDKIKTCAIAEIVRTGRVAKATSANRH